MGELVLRRRPPHPHLKALLCLALTATAAGGPACAEDLRNWFDDPFLRLTSDLADCPMPAGPYTTRQESLAQSHHRAEKGTTAWLAGEAERPKAFAYDQDIAQSLTAAFRESKRFAGTSLWATVQGRVVYIEGCVRTQADAAELEALARSLPYVQQAVAIVRTPSDARVPYKVMPPAQPASASGDATGERH